jgi:hypothetical protein
MLKTMGKFFFITSGCSFIEKRALLVASKTKCKCG